MNSLGWKNFEPLFGSWAFKIKPFFDKGGMEPIYKFLKKEARRGKRICPLSENTFRAFQETPFNELKVVIMGLSPYHTFYNGKPIADGICMSCSITKKLQPSLLKFYEEIERTLYNGLNLHIVQNPDLKYLSNQGILLTNVGYTCEKDKPGSHNFVWSEFTKFLIENVLSGTGVPMVFLGKEASKYSNYVPIFTHHFEISHPASAAYSSTDWDSEGVFKQLNKILKDGNNESIKWVEYDS